MLGIVDNVRLQNYSVGKQIILFTKDCGAEIKYYIGGIIYLSILLDTQQIKIAFKNLYFRQNCVNWHRDLF
jgi:hypothetical protein